MRALNVKVVDEFSCNVHSSAGLPQGSVLSPTLYSIYTSYISTPQICIIALYADDTAILTQGKLSNAITKEEITKCL